MRKSILLIILFFLTACAVPTAEPSLPTRTPSPTFTPSLTASLTQTSIPVPTETSTPTLILKPTLTNTPDPYWQYTMQYLSSRDYGEGNLEILEVMDENSSITRYLIRYPSDGLMIYGFLNVPVKGGSAGEGPFPVIIALHGYIEPELYNTLDYTTGYADALARAGYIVFHPNLRGYLPSDSGENLFRVGMALDVLNLIGIVSQNDWAGTPLENSNPQEIGLWGHSMGGGISTRVMLISPEVDAVVLYAPMSGDEKQNWDAINVWSGGARGLDEIAFPETELDRISPMYFFDQLAVPVSLHHGLADDLVPFQWSVQTCEQLTTLGKEVECWYYDNMPHTFVGVGDQLFITRTIEFFDRILK